MPRYKPKARACQRSAGTPATVLNPQGTREGQYPAAYLCISCARDGFPDLFPKQERNRDMFEEHPELLDFKTPRQLVPLDREAGS